MKTQIRFLLTFTMIFAFAISPTAFSFVQAVPASWTKGDEIPITGHSFNEEYWTNDSVVVEDDKGDTSYAVNYINSSGVEVFMVAANMRRNNNTGQNGTMPFQFYGMHYETPNGSEVFIVSVLAFLYAFNDTYNGTIEDGVGQGLPDPGNEPFYYIYPFGVTNNETEYDPEVEVHEVTKNGPGDYTFGVTYRNLYAKVLNGETNATILASLLLPIWFIRFSELTITYHVEINNDTGTVHTETFYEIGQISRIYLFGLNVSTSVLNQDTWGIGAAHYVSVFTSNYRVSGQQTNTTYAPSHNQVATENMTIRVGDDDERAFDVNLHGTYDLVNETTNSTVQSGLPAKNILVQARRADLFFIWLQMPIALRLVGIFAYSHSTYIQGLYNNPRALVNNGGHRFTSSQLWYAVQFQPWRGLRVEHDPEFVAYATLGLQVNPNPDDTPVGDTGGLIVLAGGIIGLVIVAALISRRRHK